MLFKNTLGGHPIKSEANYREISNLGAMTTINKLQIERSEHAFSQTPLEKRGSPIGEQPVFCNMGSC